MASGIFSILDDVAALMDDVAAASQVATRKTAGILADDLAVNAEKATGFLATRELPVLWAITKGSFINKLIIVPIALILTAVSPITIKAILVLGAIYLAYEGAEKLIEFFFKLIGKDTHAKKKDVTEDADLEKKKIKSAITTDFILSIEIVIIALGTVLEKSMAIQIITVSIVSLLATVGVYGLVALVVRMDDLGFNLMKRANGKGALAKLGSFLVKLLPLVIKSFTYIGTIALLLVSGGILVHYAEFLHHMFSDFPSFILEMMVGLVVGLMAATLMGIFKRVFRRK